MIDYHIITHYFPNITEKQVEQFKALQTLYTDWNEKINVISRKDIDALYEKHILHSLAIAKFIEFEPNTTVLDVGTGGGFPGVPLAILFPQVHFTLIDVIGKKIRVVKNIVEDLGLTNVQAEQKRASTVTHSFDFIVSRAVTRMEEFVPWVNNKIKAQNKHSIKNGILYLKGGDLSEELQHFPQAKCYPIASWFKEDFFETKQVVYLPLNK